MIKLTSNKSPKGFGLNAHEQKINLIKQGLDGKIWIVKSFNGIKRWVIHDFYKDFKKAEIKLIKLLKKSIIEFKYISIQYKLRKNKNYFKDQISENTKLENIYFPEITITASINNNFDLIISPIEFDTLCCESGFYKYVRNTGSDSSIINKKIVEKRFFYKLSDDCKIWKDYEKTCKRYNNEMVEFIQNNQEIINKLPKNKQQYLYTKYL